MPLSNGSPGQATGRAKSSLPKKRSERSLHKRTTSIYTDVRKYGDFLRQIQRLMIEVILILGLLGFIWWFTQHEFLPIVYAIKQVTQ